MTGSHQKNSAKTNFRQAQKPKQPAPISLRLTHEERAMLEKAAAGMTLSAYIRLRLFDKNVKPRKTRNKAPVKDHKALAQILALVGQSRVPNNLNQIAKAVHIGVLPLTPEVEADIRKACEEVRQIRDMLIFALGLKIMGDK